MEPRKRLAEIVERQSDLYKAGNWREAADLDATRLELEREVADAEGRPFAEVIEWSPRWSSGAPLPHVLTNGLRTFLTYYVQENDPTWDGTWTKARDPSRGEAEPMAIVSFDHCVASMMGPPNDEVLHGHPLHGSGLGGYDAHVVRRSPWISSFMAINSVHEYYDEARWSGYSHYLLVFHDEVFECVAESFTIDVETSPLQDVLRRLSDRLTSG